MKDYKPSEGIVVVNNPNFQGLICQCGNTDKNTLVPHIEIISRRKDVRGRWFEKTKDFLKCTICGELQILDEDFIKARKDLDKPKAKRVYNTSDDFTDISSTYTRTPVRVGTELTPEKLEEVAVNMQKILKENALTPEFIPDVIGKLEITDEDIINAVPPRENKEIIYGTDQKKKKRKKRK